jgi:predicted DNA-binding transcriptional regulator YafY
MSKPSVIKVARTSRLLKLQTMLWQHSDGLSIKDIADKCSSNIRTSYRDLRALEFELGVPIWENEHKRGICKGNFNPMVFFTPAESVYIFLAVRLMQQVSQSYDPCLVSTCMKLNTFVGHKVGKHIQDIIDQMESQPKDKRKINNLNTLTQAWISRHRVMLTYQSSPDEKPEERFIDPYFIEPAMRGHSGCVIAYCHQKKSICVFNIDCIVDNVCLENQSYEIPQDFNFSDYLLPEYGLNPEQDIRIDGGIQTIELQFPEKMSQVVMHSSWHPSQKIEIQPDGSLIVTIKIHVSNEFIAWLLGWGVNLTVLKPKSLKKQIMQALKQTYANYSSKKIKRNELLKSLGGIQNWQNTELTDEQWEMICPLLPPHIHTGRPRGPDRSIINGILWMLKNNAKWADIPRNYGASSTCFYRFKAWQKHGIWENICHVLSISA